VERRDAIGPDPDDDFEKIEPALRAQLTIRLGHTVWLSGVLSPWRVCCGVLGLSGCWVPWKRGVLTKGFGSGVCGVYGWW